MKSRIYQWCSRFLKEEDGPTAVEYAVMLALIIAVCIASVVSMGEASADVWQQTADALDAVTN